ncbi:MAG TPA: HAMP domain-containing sensor histidine kinase [Stellaceae bacterium]|nr:HAMP domain-containing sensor histidine kinase [Stellaceae bacterium]
MPTSRESITAAQLRLLMKSPFPIYAAAVTAALTMIILRNDLDSRELFGWGAAMLIWQGLRLGLSHLFHRTQVDDAGAIRWLWPIGVLMTGSGLLWGLFSIGFYEVQDVEMRVFMLFVLTSMITGGSVSFTAYLPAYYGYLVGATLPIALTFVLHGTNASVLMGFVTATYVAFLVIMAQAANRAVTDLIELQLEKAALVSDLSLAKEAAEQASRVKSHFLANMSHELRTPLNAIIGFSDVIRNQLFGTLGSPRYLDYITDINHSGHHLLRLVNDILDLSKLEAGAVELSNDRIDLRQLVGECMNLLRAQAAEHHLSLAVEVPATLSWLHADELRLKQVMLNLLSNAVKFSWPGGRVAVTAEVTPDGGMAISVQDTGVGMTEAEIQVALKPFRQVESSVSRRHAGTGLGLPLAKTLAEQHGGTLRVTSARDIGTTVTVYLPAWRVSPRSGAPDVKYAAAG